MGVVHLGFDYRLDRNVAVKRLRPEIAEDSGARERFLTEARAAARLDHPNIVRIHSALEAPEGLFLVFEYIHGGSLAERLAGGPLPPPEALGLLEQIAAGLDYAHGRGVLHQDLKPANILATPEGKAKIADFGIAHVAPASSHGWAAGTPGYMAPEQADGQPCPASDIYSLAVCACELLTGLPLAPPGPAPLAAALLRSLEADPGLRHPTASALVADIRRAS